MPRNIIDFLESVMIIGAVQAGLTIAGVVMLNVISRIGV